MVRLASIHESPGTSDHDTDSAVNTARTAKARSGPPP
jgi:hypothetical protein